LNAVVYESSTASTTTTVSAGIAASRSWGRPAEFGATEAPLGNRKPAPNKRTRAIPGMIFAHFDKLIASPFRQS
jgi:hypothetical protein